MRYSRCIASAAQSVAASLVRRVERILSPAALPLSAYRNFLLLQHPSALGTAIHATPLIRALHAAIPGSHVAATASGFSLDILSGNPQLERLIPIPSPLSDWRGASKALRTARPFGDEAFVALQTQGNERTLVAAAAMFGGVHTRVGFSVEPRLSAAPLQIDPSVSLIANNLRIIAALGHGEALDNALANQPDLIEPVVFPSERHFHKAEALLLEQGIDLSRPITVFVTQTSVTQRKSWRPERFRAVAEMLYREYDAQIVFAGTSGEASAIDALRSPLPFATATVAGKTNLLELSALMALTDIALTLDTGPMHLARAVRLPMVIIAPAWSPPVEWLPLNNPRARILKNADFPAAPPDYIIDEVSVEEAEQNLRDLLTLYPPRTFTWRA